MVSFTYVLIGRKGNKVWVAMERYNGPELSIEEAVRRLFYGWGYRGEVRKAFPMPLVAGLFENAHVFFRGGRLAIPDILKILTKSEEAYYTEENGVRLAMLIAPLSWWA